ncbi:LysR family transcriptional regulator [Pelagibacterium lacus]|uniref:LysR family transcriptional regulator n=1 Tax=Pelagibacterium lacus TaxID=2282655 RepID=A0A369W6A8_9HYPH|nr:LysR family transcriptional regulator [Pelagibacterium lacus]RDE10078.1 LysR family transcriptional regulator [Pelagibacterium lacus]
MRYFAQVVEKGNMTKAAEALNVAQPALGLQIRQLEDLLGTPLFDRHSRGVAVTAAGRILYERAKVILQLMEEAENEIQSLTKSKRETLTLGVTPSIMGLIGGDILTTARQEMPKVFLRLVEEPSFLLVEGIARNDVDIALVYDVEDQVNLRSIPLVNEELLLVQRYDASLADREITFGELAKFELVLVHDRDPIRQKVEAEARNRDISLEIAYEVQSLNATLDVIKGSDVVSVMPYGTVAAALERKELSARRIVSPIIQRTLYVSRHARRGRFLNEEAISRFVELLVARFTERLPGCSPV